MFRVEAVLLTCPMTTYTYPKRGCSQKGFPDDEVSGSAISLVGFRCKRTLDFFWALSEFGMRLHVARAPLRTAQLGMLNPKP